MDRETQIIELLLQHRELSLEELAEKLGVSSSTAHRQIKSLDGNRLIQRTRGGIRLATAINYESVPTYKWPVDSKEASAIANRAVELIQRGDVIALSGGLICTRLALRIKLLEGITVVTNAINIAVELTAVLGIQVKLTGGVLNRDSFELTGPSVHQGLTDIYISKFFLGTSGLSVEHGVTNYDEAEALASSEIMKHSESIILLADSKKFGRPNFAKVCSISDIDTIVTTDNVAPSILDELRHAGVNVELATSP